MAAYGNYRAYQGSARTATPAAPALAAGSGSNAGKFPAAHTLDGRLALLTHPAHQPDLFGDKRVLDVGCNAGGIAVDIALRFRPRSVTGLERDPALVARAKSHFSFRWSRLGPRGELDYFPVSAVEAAGHVAYPLSSQTEAEAEAEAWGVAPNRVRFFCGDFFTWSPPSPDRAGEDGAAEDGGGRYDVITMLSAIKWMHLDGGDAGLHAIFQKCWRLLAPGGHLVLEPQPWESYEKAVKKNPQLRPAKEALDIRPEQFGAVLERDIGFVLVERIDPGEGGGGGGSGPRRGIYVWRKHC